MAKLSDTALCGCKSDWVAPMDRIITEPISTHLDHQFINDGGPLDSICSICRYWYQLNPLYENMLFDLRSMNQIW